MAAKHEQQSSVRTHTHTHARTVASHPPMPRKGAWHVVRYVTALSPDRSVSCEFSTCHSGQQAAKKIRARAGSGSHTRAEDGGRLGHQTRTGASRAQH